MELLSRRILNHRETKLEGNEAEQMGKIRIDDGMTQAGMTKREMELGAVQLENSTVAQPSSSRPARPSVVQRAHHPRPAVVVEGGTPSPSPRRTLAARSSRRWRSVAAIAVHSREGRRWELLRAATPPGLFRSAALPEICLKTTNAVDVLDSVVLTRLIDILR
nr:hypothetical protein Iba_chr08fCG2740 [Ipomoea batatas]